MNYNVTELITESSLMLCFRDAVDFTHLLGNYIQNEEMCPGYLGILC